MQCYQVHGWCTTCGTFNSQTMTTRGFDIFKFIQSHDLYKKNVFQVNGPLHSTPLLAFLS